MLLRRASVRDDRLGSTSIRSGDNQDDACSHKESLNNFGRFGNRPRIRPSEPGVEAKQGEYDLPGAGVHSGAHAGP